MIATTTLRFQPSKQYVFDTDSTSDRSQRIARRRFKRMSNRAERRQGKVELREEVACVFSEEKEAL